MTLRIALLCGLASACARDSKEELRSWAQSACSCESLLCAQAERVAFWKLVQEFADDEPTAERAQALDSLIDEGQSCLRELEVDIYALN
jgi:hypothetical protein